MKQKRSKQYNEPMFDLSTNIFKQPISLSPTAKIVFVSDMFVNDYIGGAELTSEALITSSPIEIYKLHSQDMSEQLVMSGIDKFWIFGNCSQIGNGLISLITHNLRYSVLEYDYKYCSYRSPEKHLALTGMPCSCHNQPHGKMIAEFYSAAKHLWWMSQAQMDRYHTLFPQLEQHQNTVISSVFSAATLDLIRKLRSENPPKEGWIILGSSSWIKGVDAARQWCEHHKKQYEALWDVPYEHLLQRLARAECFVYLPLGGDTCPRMVIEAKLLGCKLQLNDNVQHAKESWFIDDVENIETYLRSAPHRFWRATQETLSHRPTISGYTTTYNCVKQQYPLKQCIQSMLEFCDEVCVVDGGSTDETFDMLVTLAYPRISVATLEDMRFWSLLITENLEFPDEFGHGDDRVKRDPKIRVKLVKRDWTHPRHAVFDGMQKAEARKMCTENFCWQMDCDEVVHEDDGPKIRQLVERFPTDSVGVTLPVIEFWGGPEKVRFDVTPWKWRLSRNLPNITHGIPKDLRRYDDTGHVYASMGTDGCDVIDSVTGDTVHHRSFYSREAHEARRAALAGDQRAALEYGKWFNVTINNLPCVFHYSWYDIERKIRLYRDYWQDHWRSLYDQHVEDTAENNMFFDQPWHEITDEMISVRAKELAKTGGHVFHTKWKGQPTPSMGCTRSQPKWMMQR